MPKVFTSYAWTIREMEEIFPRILKRHFVGHLLLAFFPAGRLMFPGVEVMRR